MATSKSMRFNSSLVNVISPKGTRLSKRNAHFARVAERCRVEEAYLCPVLWPRVCLADHTLKSFYTLGYKHCEANRHYVTFIGELNVVVDNISKPIPEWTDRMRTIILGQPDYNPNHIRKSFAQVVKGHESPKVVIGQEQAGPSYAMKCIKSLLSFIWPQVNIDVCVQADFNEAFRDVKEDPAIKTLFASAIAQIGDTFGLIKSMSTEIIRLLTILVVIYGLYCVSQSCPKSWLVVVPFMVVLWPLIFPKHTLDFLKKQLPFFFGSRIVEQEEIIVGEEQSPNFKPALIVGSLLATYFGINKDTFQSSVVDALLKVKKIPKMANEFEEMIENCWEVVRTVINCLLPICGISQIAATVVDHVKFQEKAMAFRTGVMTRDIKANFQTADEYKALIKEGSSLLRKSGGNREARQSVSGTLNSLVHVAGSLGSAFVNAVNSRAEPVCLCIAGGSGIGKSRLMKDLHVRVASKYVPKDVAASHGYSLNHEIYTPGKSDYDEGYTGQFTWMEDDFGQALEAPFDKASSFMKIIQYVNSAPASMNMAFEQKGTVFFDSKLILLTTNAEDGFLAPAAKILNDPKALERRVMCFKAKLKEDWATKLEGSNIVLLDKHLALEEKKRKIEQGLVAVPDDFWEFYRMNFVTGLMFPVDKKNADGDPRGFTYEEIVELVTNQLATNVQEAQEIDDSTIRLAHELYGEKYVPLADRDKNDVGYVAEVLLEAFNVLKSLGAKIGAIPSNTVDWMTSLLSKKALNTLNEAAEFKKHCCTVLTEGLASILSHKKIIGMILLVGSSSALVYGAWKTVSLIVGGICRMFQKDEPLGKAIRTSGVAAHAITLRQKILSLWKNKDFEVDEDGNPVGIKPEAMLRVAEETHGFEQASLIWADEGIIPQAVSDYWNKIRKNAVSIVVETTNGSEHVIGTAWMLQNYVMAYPYHFDYVIDRLVGVKRLLLKRVFRDGEKPKTVCSFDDINLWKERRRIVEEEEELIVSYVPLAGMFAKIVDLFPTEASLPKPRSRPVEVQVVNPTLLNGESETAYMQVKCMRDSTLRLDASGPNDRHLNNVMRYNSKLMAGACGSIVIRTDGVGQSPLLGMHIAGSPDPSSPVKQQGWCCLMSQERLRRAILAVSPQNAVIQALEDICDMNEDCPMEEPAFEGIGKLLEGSSFVPTKTKSAKTKLQDKEVFGPATRGPAILDPNHPVGIVRNALLKYTSEVKALPVTELRKAADETFKQFLESTVDLRTVARVRTNEEAVTGIVDGERLLPGINRKSSPGFPFNVIKGKIKGMGSKQGIFGSDDYDFDNPRAKEVFRQVDEVIEAAKQGKRMEHVFTDFPKDEKRPHDKVAKGATRLISGGPLVYTLACRRLFMDFIHAFENNRIGKGPLPSLVGINPYCEYDGLARNLREVGDKFIAGDFSSFDGSEQPDLHHILFDVIAKWYAWDEDHNIARKILFLDLTNSIHLGGLKNNRKTLYMWLKCLPSGHPLTCIINTMYNMVAFRWCFIKLCPGLNFEEHVRAAYFGDDNLHGISDDVCQMFNQMTITQQMKVLGLTYTNSQKGDSTEAYTSFEEVDILKRKFRLEKIGDRKFYVAPLCLVSIAEMMYWWKPRPGVTEISFLEDQLKMFLREMSLHPYEIWQQFVPPLLSSMRDEYNFIFEESAQGIDLYKQIQLETVEHAEVDY